MIRGKKKAKAPDLENNLNKGVYIIPIMGPTGAGKSSFINQLTKVDVAEVGNSFDSCTRGLQPIEIPADEVRAHLPRWNPQPAAPNSEKKLIIVDTPGFDDSSVDDSEILKRIADWLVKTYGAGTLLSGIIYLQDISAPRYTGATKRNFEVFSKLCGKDACKSVILGTTKWAKEDYQHAQKKEQQLHDKYWKDMISAGSTMLRVDSPTTKGSPWDLVETALLKGESPILQIQTELLVLERTLPQTEAAQVLRGRIEELIKSMKNSGATKEELQGLKQEVEALKEKSNLLARLFGRFFG